MTDSSGNTLRIRRDTNRLPVRVVAPDNQVRIEETADAAEAKMKKNEQNPPKMLAKINSKKTKKYTIISW